MTDARFEPHNSGVTPRFQEVATFMRAAQATIEPGGIPMRDLQVMLRSLTGATEFVGGDICEIVPGLDPTGITCVNAATIMFEIACLVAESRARLGPNHGADHGAKYGDGGA